MNAQTEILAPDPARFDHAAFHGFAPPPGATRHEGWAPDKQRRFLEALSEGLTVKQACAVVGLSRQSAYALRQSPRGQAFALGWDAAVVLSRNALADDLMERARHGNYETVTGDDGAVVTRHRYDNRLGMQMLNRLDRMAERSEGAHAAVRLVATDFAQYLDLIERDGGPARAGMFLGARVEPASEDALAPLRALARADQWLRTHSDLALPVPVADLDPAARAAWTAEQWARAEAAGLVALAPAPPESCQACQPADGPDDLPPRDSEGDAPVWWCDYFDAWCTSFPPPDDFDGEEDGEFGSDGYARTLSEAEAEAYEAPFRAEVAARTRVEGRARDLFFGFAAAGGDAPAAALCGDAPPTAECGDAPPAADAERPAASDPAPRDAPERQTARVSGADGATGTATGSTIARRRPRGGEAADG